MKPFTKLWTFFIDVIKPQGARERHALGPHSMFVDTRPFQSRSKWH